MAQPVFRFAPSPNGYLHLGHALSAILNFELARAAGGRFLLRIEDIDVTRCRPEYEAAIYEDLAWLGLAWDEPVRRQSEHFDAYRGAVDRLMREGFVYPSFESRAEIAQMVAARGPSWPRDPDGVPLYPGGNRGQSVGDSDRPYALRLDMARAAARAGPLAWRETGVPPGPPRSIPAEPEAWGDVVLARKETPTSYHLSVVVDDALQGVTHVVRGLDLYRATGLHRLLQALVGLPEPLYGHHRLVTDAAGRKLAKSNGATSLRELRKSGVTPAGVRRMIGLA